MTVTLWDDIKFLFLLAILLLAGVIAEAWEDSQKD